MNYYSLNGSKIDSSNNLFENKPIYETFNNTQTQNKSSPLDNSIEDDDEFASVPTTKSNATDTNFQCSDGYDVKGSNLGNQNKNSTLAECKTMCANAGNDCIGFNFNNKNNVCTLKKNASSMDNNNNSTLCIKKSAGEAGCKVNTNQNNSDSVKAFNELDSIFNENESQNLIEQNENTNIESIYPMEVPQMVNNEISNNDLMSETESENNSETVPETNMSNNPPGVYIDMDCFMKNINVLQNRSDNMMIDLSLLLSNIKTCSYVKKNTTDNKLKHKGKMNSKELIEQITSKINIPQPDTVKLNNVKANVMVSDGQNVPAQILEISKEPFDTNSETSSNSYNWNYKDLVLIVIIVIIIYLLIFRK